MNARNDPASRPIRSVYLEPSESPVEYQRDALRYWQEKRGRGRFAPSWSDVSLMDFPPAVIPALIVLDINPQTHEMKYRFWGTQLTELHGQDYTGRSPGELLPVLHSVGNIDAYGVLIKEKKPQLEIKEFYRMELLKGRQMVLRLPLSDDGETVTKSLNVTYQELTGKSRPYSEFFEIVLATEGEEPHGR